MDGLFIELSIRSGAHFFNEPPREKRAGSCVTGDVSHGVFRIPSMPGQKVSARNSTESERAREKERERGMTFFGGERGKPLKFLTTADVDERRLWTRRAR